MCNFSRHHKLEAHKKAALLFLGIKADTTLDMKAPTLQQFLDVIDFVAKGNAANQGLDSVGQGKKIKKMAACLAEAMWEQDRNCFGAAESISIHRDESHGRLAVIES